MAADVLAGFEAAISDVFDVLSISLCGKHQLHENAIAIGSFHAVANGSGSLQCRERRTLTGNSY